MFKHRCQCGNAYESFREREVCMNCRRVTDAEPFYIEAPFTAEWGTQAWIDDAMARCRRASEEFARAATQLSVETDLQMALELKQVLIAKADALVRVKWLQREIVRAMERLVTPVVIRP
jgi:hypothetical protein